MTKRVYEAAKEYGVPAKTVIKTLEDHHIKAGNFTGIDANMKSILDASFKKGAQGEAQRGHKQENKQTGEGTSRKVNETSRQNKNKKQGNTPKQNNQNHDKKRQNQGNGQNQPNRGAKAAQGQNQGSRPQQNHKGGNHGGQSSQGQQGDNKRTKYFGHSQGGNDSNNRGSNSNKNKRGGQNNRNNKNNGGNRPHTLLSNVLNKGKHNKNKRNQKRQAPVAQEAPKKKNYPTSVELPETIIVKDFAERLGRDVGEVMKKLLMGGIMATINQELDFETASLIADEFGVTVTKEAPPEDPTEIEEIIDPPETLKTRPPVVTIMGHVDHGKTSLLDAIRQTNVTSHEAGGITQHIGAYQVRYQGKKITFMDTPGHEAFTAMRARGAQVTDIAVLVVAADDGVMPQTIESINHAKSAGVPIIVAINKIDKESANPEHVMQQLTEYGLISEDWGGDTIMVPVSAHKKIGLDDLLENILVLAEVQDLKANPNRPAQGVVIEAKLDKGRGPVASVLIQKGTLRVGDTIIVGTCFGKVRAMNNERGERVKKAEPSIPVEILGLNDVPEAGDILNVTDEKTARSVAEKRLEKKRSSELHVNAKVTLDDLFNQIQQGELKELPLIIKGDVQGSVEALSQSLMGIKSDEVRISIVHSGVGAINESDIMLASASNALIIGFNVRPDAAARKMAEHEKVDMRMYRVIYDAINDVEAAIKGMLEKKYEEKIVGRAEVRKVITTPKVIVGGSYVKEGKITSSSKIRLIRNGIVVHEGEIDGLRRFKDDVKEVPAGYECGITLEKYRDIKEGDEIEAYEMVEVEPE
ncbi:translation initiation factor IF-2 [Megasphaera elsdenii]|uniref:translation initiation factor IF-2 n=1 Tax=Megasphaera elsdenii TaxID=907 RepID=UPI001D002AC4|nr:translation initiation factor IF-2 [Megasphaera elsdenii]MCB5702702.1 translation initiation factor IF-2 [Megasphaera elsdenii]MCB5727512.1 translation initiation factor IF-2 [Megasphaera elsdenii]MCB5771291.1 translation initiation factor IF-2 [Megasphaera elsdenii]